MREKGGSVPSSPLKSGWTTLGAGTREGVAASGMSAAEESDPPGLSIFPCQSSPSALAPQSDEGRATRDERRATRDGG
jgi:hypothetical protein